MYLFIYFVQIIHKMILGVSKIIIFIDIVYQIYLHDSAGQSGQYHRL